MWRLWHAGGIFGNEEIGQMSALEWENVKQDGNSIHIYSQYTQYTHNTHLFRALFLWGLAWVIHRTLPFSIANRCVKK